MIDFNFAPTPNGLKLRQFLEAREVSKPRALVETVRARQATIRTYASVDAGDAHLLATSAAGLAS